MKRYRMEGKSNKKKKEGQKGRRNSGRKEEFKKKSFCWLSTCQFSLVLLVFLSVEQFGMVGRIGFTFLPS